MAQLCEWAQLIKSCTVIGQTSRQDGTILFGNTYSVWQGKYLQKPYDKSFVDQACEVKETGYGLHTFTFFACLWTSTPSQFINTCEKRTYYIQCIRLDLTLGQ